MPVRANILESPQARERFIEGVLLLNRQLVDVDSQDLGITDGPGAPLSVWDLFVLWHYHTMNVPTPPGSGRNAAHRGPVFLPWHRWMLLLLEQSLQRVLEDPDFGLPYWDWGTDGDQPPSEQPVLELWDHVGHGGMLSDGPFAFRADDPESFRVRVWENVSLFRHRLDDPLLSMLTALGESDQQGPLVSEMLDLSGFVDPAQLPTYDRLPATVP